MTTIDRSSPEAARLYMLREFERNPPRMHVGQRYLIAFIMVVVALVVLTHLDVAMTVALHVTYVVGGAVVLLVIIALGMWIYRHTRPRRRSRD